MTEHEKRFLIIMLIAYCSIVGALVHVIVKKACGGQSVFSIIASYFRKKP